MIPTTYDYSRLHSSEANALLSAAGGDSYSAQSDQEVATGILGGARAPAPALVGMKMKVGTGSGPKQRINIGSSAFGNEEEQARKLVKLDYDKADSKAPASAVASRPARPAGETEKERDKRIVDRIPKVRVYVARRCKPPLGNKTHAQKAQKGMRNFKGNEVQNAKVGSSNARGSCIVFLPIIVRNPTPRTRLHCSPSRSTGMCLMRTGSWRRICGRGSSRR